MRAELIEILADRLAGKRSRPAMLKAPPPKKVKDKKISYTERHRGSWHDGEYDLAEIQIIQHTDSYVARSIDRKLHRFLVAGHEFVGRNSKYVEYIRQRILEMELATGRPFALQMADTARDLIRFKNCMWIKARNSEFSSGKIRRSPTDRKLDPVAGYFILPFETLEFKTKNNGDLKKIQQVMPSGKRREFFVDDVIHFYMNRNPGFAIGTPDLIPVIDDIELLRRIEENVEELLESNLYPLFHYQIGSDEIPERKGPDGRSESDIMRGIVEYMPAGGIFFSDHRHNISAIGSEGRALRVESYLDYFKSRLFAGLGMSGIDFGEGNTSNRSTADTMSKGALQDIEALQIYMKMFVEKEVIQELLLEGGFGMDAFLPENKVEIQFGIINKEERSRLENQAIQKFLNNAITHEEFRKELGLPPMTEEDLENTHFKMYEEPMALIKASALGLAAGDALAKAPTSAVTQEGLNKENKRQKEEAKAKNAQGRPPSNSSTKARNANSNTTSPRNQHGSRGSQKFNKDFSEKDLYTVYLSSGGEDTSLLNNVIREFKVARAEFHGIVANRVAIAAVDNVTVRDSLDWRWQGLCDRFFAKAFNAGVIVGAESLDSLSPKDLICTDEACIQKLLTSITNTDEVFRTEDIPPFS